MTFLEIDGSFGDRGGQIPRTSLALSLVTGTPFRMLNMRVKRAEPGLRRQHLTAVRAAARIGNAQVEGDAINSTSLTFIPDAVAGGRYEFDGSAGSTTLVFQTVLPALLLCGNGSTVTFRGGTHNHGGPPWDFLDVVFLPAIRQMGARVNVHLRRYGFVPAGGGEWTAEVVASKLHPVHLRQRGEPHNRMVKAVISNLPVSITERELDTVRRTLRWPESAFKPEIVDSDGPGNVVMIHGAFSQAAELVTGFGRRVRLRKLRRTRWRAPRRSTPAAARAWRRWFVCHAETKPSHDDERGYDQPIPACPIPHRAGFWRHLDSLRVARRRHRFVT